MSSNHVSTEQLVDLIEGRLDPAVEARGRVHLAGCARCAETRAWLERVIGAMRADDREEPPARVAGYISGLFAARPAPASPLRQIVAALRFDSALQPLPLGKRSAPLDERQMVFGAPGLAIDLRIVSAEQEYSLAGQVLGAGPPGRIELRGLEAVLRADLGADGEFVLRSVPRGIYHLSLQLRDVEITIPELEIGA